MIIHKTAQKQSGLKLKRWKKSTAKGIELRVTHTNNHQQKNLKLNPCFNEKSVASWSTIHMLHQRVTNKSWPGHRLSSHHYAANATQPLLVRWCWRWPGITGHGANRSEANCWHWIYSQNSAGRSSGGKSHSVFPFWLPCCPRAWACQWFLEVLVSL